MRTIEISKRLSQFEEIKQRVLNSTAKPRDALLHHLLVKEAYRIAAEIHAMAEEIHNQLLKTMPEAVLRMPLSESWKESMQKRWTH